MALSLQLGIGDIISSITNFCEVHHLTKEDRAATQSNTINLAQQCAGLLVSGGTLIVCVWHSFLKSYLTIKTQNYLLLASLMGIQHPY